LSGNIPLDQLVKGFHAAFWFGLGCSVVAALLAMTLKIGTRGHKGEKDMRNEPETHVEQSRASSATTIPVEMIAKA